LGAANYWDFEGKGKTVGAVQHPGGRGNDVKGDWELSFRDYTRTGGQPFRGNAMEFGKMIEGRKMNHCISLKWGRGGGGGGGGRGESVSNPTGELQVEGRGKELDCP